MERRDRTPKYIVQRKDGLYLSKWRRLGVSMMSPDGKRTPVNACLFVWPRSKAHVFNTETKAREVTLGLRDAYIVRIN